MATPEPGYPPDEPRRMPLHALTTTMAGSDYLLTVLTRADHDSAWVVLPGYPLTVTGWRGTPDGLASSHPLKLDESDPSHTVCVRIARVDSPERILVWHYPAGRL